MQVLKSLVSLSDFSSELYYYEDNWIRLFSWICAWGKCENVAFALSHQKYSAALLSRHRYIPFRRHKSALDDLGSLVNFLERNFACCSSHSAILPLFSPQEPGCSRPWLLLFGPVEVRASCCLHCAGDCSALPSLHMERVLAQITVRVHAPTADRSSLSVLQHHGPKPLFQ